MSYLVFSLLGASARKLHDYQSLHSLQKIIKRFIFAMLLGVTYSAYAGTFYCTDPTSPPYLNGVIDGYDPATFAYISSTNNTLGINSNCLIKNWPQNNGIGGFPITNINYWFPGGADYYIVFDNVYYPGNMSCNDPTNSNFWIYWAPGSFNKISSKCQNFMVPVDMVVKSNPPAQTTATIGVPFTYTITQPKLGAWNVSSYTFSTIAQSDTAEIRNLVLVDDLTLSGVGLTYVTNQAWLLNVASGTRTLLNGGAPLVLGASAGWLSAHPGVLSDATKHLVFSYENNADLVSVPPGYRIDIELTVVLDNDIVINSPGKQFTNTSEMWFDKVISYTRADGSTGTTAMSDLHAWPGTTLPLTIAAPNLVLTKTSTMTNLNVGTNAPFTLNVQNVGGSNAWDTTITDNIPGGMCIFDPRPSLTAAIYQSDGATKVTDLVLGSDYTVNWNGGTAAACQLTLTTLDSSAIAKIGPTQRLLIKYNAQLDPGTPAGLQFINYAGATQWYNATSSYTGRHVYNNTITNGTPGTLDFQDAYTITSATQGYFFLKSVADVTTGVSPANAAFAGDTLRYTIQLQNFTFPRLDNINISDILDALNSPAAFVPGSLTNVVTDIPGPNITVNSNGGPNGTGSIAISGLTLNSNQQYSLQFDITLASNLSNGTIVYNQASLISSIDQFGTPWSGISDDPYLNGPKLLSSSDLGDKTAITIQAPGALSKANPIKATAAIGEQFTYTVTVPASAANVALYDVQIYDNLGLSNAKLNFVGAIAHLDSGAQSWTLTNVGTSTNLILKEITTGIDIPAGDRAIVEITVALADDAINTDGLTYANQAYYSYNKLNGVATTQATGGGATTSNMTVVEPQLTVSKAVSYASPAGKLVTAAAAAGDILQYTVTVTNNGTSTAFDTNLLDMLPSNLAYVAGSATAAIAGVPVAGFIATPTLNGSSVIWGKGNNDETLDIPVGQSLVLTYRATVISVNGTAITNNAYVDWTSLDNLSAAERHGDGCPTTIAPDSYCSGPASTTITSLDPTTLGKTLLVDSWDSGLSTNVDALLRVGDTADYALVVNIREGVSQSVVVTDLLPVGLAFDQLVVVSSPANITYSAPAAPAPGATGTITWSLGTVTNTPDNNPANDTITIVYRARVRNGSVLAQTPSDQALTNNATLSYSVNGIPATRTANRSITVKQPLMTTPTKTATGFTSPASVNILTDVMPFRLQSCNNGTAPAYSARFSDLLVAEMNPASLSVPVVTVGIPSSPVTLTAGVDYSYTYDAPSSTMTFVLSKEINPGECATINYTIGFNANIAPNSTWSNSVTLNEYWSLTAPTTVGQLYGPLTSQPFVMTNPVIVTPLTKVASSPASGKVTIGEEALYQITVPGAPVNATLSNVVVSDTLNSVLEYVAATAVTGTGTPVALIDNSVAPGSVNLTIAQIPAGEQVVITLRTRVVNNAAANAGSAFTNSASYTYTGIPAGAVTSGSSGPLTIVEPLLGVTKNVTPNTSPNAGDILTYTVGLTAQAGADKSSAYDTSVVDTLSLGLVYAAGSATVGGTPAAPVVSGDGITTPQTLTWSGIDVPLGALVPVVYNVQVLNTISAGQVLSNSATARWTSLSGASSFERTGSATPTLNDYFATATTSLTVGDNTSLAKAYVSDTYSDATTSLRVGDLIEYSLTLGLQEGTTNNVVVSDLLPTGMAYDSLVSIAPSSGSSNFTYSVASQPATDATGSVSWNLGSVVNAGDNNPANDYLVITYRARVLNNHVLAQTPSTQALSNTATLNYTIGGVAAPAKNASLSVNVLQPILSVTKSAAPAGGNSVIDAGELISYTVDITNNGTAPAYDTVLTDTLPLGLRQSGVTTTSITLVNAATSLPLLPPAYDATSGVASWNFDSGVADAYTIPAGETLRVVYQLQADATLGAGVTLTNSATVSLYYSFDNNAVPSGNAANREVYGPTAAAVSTLTSTIPGALAKAATQPTATIGEQFKYTITVPATPVAIALHDVRILDDLTTAQADLRFVSVTKLPSTPTINTGSWLPINTGTVTNLVIEDTTNGIDIPAGQQVVIEVTVELLNTAKNVKDLPFTNSADYTYNRFANDVTSRTVGTPGSSGAMTIVEPDALTLQKSGPTLMRRGVPENFTLNVQNIGNSRAWDVTLTDLIPNPTLGGMCSVAPTIVSAGIYQADGTTLVSTLLAGSDYTTSFVSATPTCTYTFTGLTAKAALDATQRLIVVYQAQLDSDNPPAATLTNIAGVTQWFSLDTAGAGATGQTRTYTRTLSNGTVGTLDHEDAVTVTVASPVISIQKTVQNMTSGQNPGISANPGDTLRYTITVANQSNVDIPDFALLDDLGLHTATAVFVPGSLAIVSTPGSSDSSNTNINGGTNGAGLLDVRDLALGVQGSPTASVSVVFEARLATVIDSGTVVLNQGSLSSYGYPLGVTDDPNVSGTDNPTRTVIVSAPQMQVVKSSVDVSGDPNVLLPGDTLRYTITVKNIGTENATGVTLSDVIPNFTTYISGTTRLNSAVVAEPTPGISPLQTGMLINAPENTSAGVMRADASATTANVATITFDVVINAATLSGTIISNQGFVTGSGNGTSGPFAQTPSDDPNTTAANDPTLNVVGSVPLIDATKMVAIVNDVNLNGALDPGDTVRYTITVNNLSGVDATTVVLTDGVPANTSYVADSVRLNGIAVGTPDGGISPLITGIAVNSSGSASGTVAGHSSATVTFDVAVNGGTAAGTVITNQGYIASTALPTEPTDADGIDTNGDQPTTIMVGYAQQLSIVKAVSVVGGGAALAGGQLEYLVTVTNSGLVPATTVLLSDDLSAIAAQVSYVAGTATLNGLSNGTAYNGTTNVVSADYAATYGQLAPGATATLRFRVQINSAVAVGTTFTNSAQVTWNTPQLSATATVPVTIGYIPGVATLAGQIWHDANFNNTLDMGELKLPGWTVSIYRGGIQLGAVTSDSNGIYQISGLASTVTAADQYELRFAAPGAVATTAKLGVADSPFTNSMQQISAIVAASGTVVQDLNLPIDPNGVVYDSVRRTPIAGATLTLLPSGSTVALPASCFADPAQQGQVTLASGYYKFDLNPGADPSCPAAGADYVINVIPPATGYMPGVSQIIPPLTSSTTVAYSVTTCSGDAVATPAGYCEAQPSEFAPGIAVPARTTGTNYYLHLTLNNPVPESSQIFNNHIAVDPRLDNAFTISKTSPLVNVTRGQLVPYTITLRNTLNVPLQDINLVDSFPPGFKYVAGSTRLDGKPFEPLANNRQLTWNNLQIGTNTQQTFKMLFIVGSGVGEGEYVNRAQLINNVTNGAASGEANATVRVVPDPTFDCSDVIGKVFDDANRNGYQDKGEKGLPGVRLATARGLLVTTDQYGRFHITCAVVPDANRGSNFILKVDDRTLPSGYRITTENPRVERATRGKMIKFNFGAAIHRVVRIDISNGVFEPGTTDIRIQWRPRLQLLMKELKKAPSLLRVSYLAEIEEKSLVEARLTAVKQQIGQMWAEQHADYELEIETELFWRTGAPPDRSIH